MKLFYKSLVLLLFLFLAVSLTITKVHAATPTQLGGMDLNGWCAHNNEITAALNSNNQWVCTGNNQVIDFISNPTPNCVWQYNVPDAFAQNPLPPTDPNYVYTWFCYTNTITPTPTSGVMPTPLPTPTTQSIVKLQLINTDTQTAVLDPFVTGSTVNIGSTPHININAITNPVKVGSVKFNLDGKTHTENGAPYDDPGDTNGKFKAFATPPSLGTHKLIVTPYTLANAGGTVGTPITITFTVVNSIPTPTPTGAPLTDDWTMNKYDPERSSYDPANTAITANTVSNLHLLWSTPPASPSSSFGPGAISTTPIVVNNIMYYGDWSGNYFARNADNGNIIWQVNIGSFTPTSKCNPPTLGVTDSAEIKNGVIYIGGGDGNMYALRASDGSVIWKSQLGNVAKGDWLWDSPVLYNGSLYESIASFGDCPLVQGRIVKVDQATGTIQAIAKLVPDTCVGAGEWASVTVDEPNNKLYITTGTQDNSCTVNNEPNSLAMVELDATTLNILGASRIPTSEQGADSDYGVSPALSTAMINGVSTQLVSGVNKNGRLYIFKRDHISDGPIVDEVLGIGGTCPDCGQGSISTAATKGDNIIYQGSGSTTIGGTNFKSSIRAINVADGSFVWEHGLVGAQVASPTLLNGVLIVTDGNHIEFINPSNGVEIRQITPAGAASILDAPISVSRGKVFVSDLNGSIFVYGL